METEPKAAVAASGEAHPPTVAELLVTHLETHDAACPHCGYGLRNLKELRCPECGREFGITLGARLRAQEPLVGPEALTNRDRANRDWTLAFLQSNDAACALCGYNLRNLTEPRCPECGREVKLMVGMVEPYLLPWILATIFVAMAAGIGFLFIFVVVVSGEVPPMHSLSMRDLVPLFGLGYGVLAIPMTVALIVGRRVFWRMPRQGQWLAAATAFCINVGIVLAVYLVAR